MQSPQSHGSGLSPSTLMCGPHVTHTHTHTHILILGWPFVLAALIMLFFYLLCLLCPYLMWRLPACLSGRFYQLLCRGGLSLLHSWVALCLAAFPSLFLLRACHCLSLGRNHQAPATLPAAPCARLASLCAAVPLSPPPPTNTLHCHHHILMVAGSAPAH